MIAQSFSWVDYVVSWGLVVLVIGNVIMGLRRIVKRMTRRTVERESAQHQLVDTSLSEMFKGKQ